MPDEIDERSPYDLQKEIQELRRAIDQERNDREEAMIAQEHRIIPAVRQFVATFTDPTKKSQRVSAVSALAWCLVPSGGTAAGGGALIIAALTAAMTLQQVRLMSAQSQQMSIQNALAEAQRRSNQLGELGPLLDTIEQARKSVEGKPKSDVSCNDTRTSDCLRPLNDHDFGADYKAVLNSHGRLRDVEQYGLLYVPSIDVSNRIAYLTSSLRTYRSLAEDPADAECSPEADATRSDRLSSLATALAFELQSKLPMTAGDVARSVYSRSRSATTHARSYLRAIAGWIESTLSSDTPEQLRLTCSARSPERGQVLLALLRAKVDISALENRGANFQYADLRGAQFGGLIVSRLNLSYAKMRDTHLGDVILTNVRLVGADLRGSGIDFALTHSLKMDDAVLNEEALAPRQKPEKRGAYNIMRGAFIPQTRTNESTKQICERVINGLASFGSLDRYSLIELQTRPDGRYFKSAAASEPLDPTHLGLVWEGLVEGFPTKVYWLDPDCKTPSETEAPR